MSELTMEKRIYDLNANWHLLQPFLNDKKVQRTLDASMKKLTKKWKSGDAPWEHTTSDYWAMVIDEQMQEDEDYDKELNDLFYKINGADADLTDDDMWDEVLGTNDHIELNEKYFEKYAPQPGTIEFYQFKHGCHWITPFVSKLIEVALGVKSVVKSTDYHSVAYFEMDGIGYYADILIDWDSVEQHNEMGSVQKSLEVSTSVLSNKRYRSL